MIPELLLGDCLAKYDIRRDGILHVGAGMLEEADEYDALKFTTVVWVEALPDTDGARQAIADKHKHVFVNVALGREFSEDVPFHVNASINSSSFLELGTHAKLYPELVEISTTKLRQVTGESVLHFYPEARKCNMLNIDVQGTECDVAAGFKAKIGQFDCILSEVYIDEVYASCNRLDHLDDRLYSYGFLRMDTWIKPKEGWGNAFYVKRSLL